VTNLLEEYDRPSTRDARASQRHRHHGRGRRLIPLYQRPEIYTFSESLRGWRSTTLAGAFWNIEEELAVVTNVALGR